jgi:hypothetical protein
LPLAIAFLRAGYLLPAFAFFEPDFVEPDLGLELDLDLAREPDFELAEPDFELVERDFELPEPDFALVERDFELPEPDFELPEPDFELPEPDFELPERPLPLDLDSESDSVLGGSGGRATGSMRLVRSPLATSGGGSRWALSSPITSGAATRAEAG